MTGTPDAMAFDTALNEVASSLKALGDTDPEQVRRAKAVGVLADPQHALDLHATAELAADGTVPAQRPRRRAPAPARSAPTIHVHLHTDAVEGHPDRRRPGARVWGPRRWRPSTSGWPTSPPVRR